MIVYRIADCRYVKDLSGKGAALYGGRWNSQNVYVLYTAQSASLALLETVVHMGKIPTEGYCMISLEIPDAHIETINVSDLPDDWQAYPSPDYLKSVGDKFYNANKKLALKVPSVVMPEEYNVILNTQFRTFDKIAIRSHRKLSIDDRLRKP